jgi:antitoxin component of MazEF toxin-antitoxin module
MTEGVQFTIRTSIRKVGNSKGVILSGKMLSELNLVEGSEVEVSLSDTGILISPVSPKKEVNRGVNKEVNIDLSAWDSRFKAAIKACDLPDNFSGQK